MELSGVVAHLLHAFESNLAFVAHVQFLFVGDLAMLHQLLYFVEFPAAGLTFMSAKQSSIVPSVSPVPASSAKVSFYLPRRLGVVEEQL